APLRMRSALVGAGSHLYFQPRFLDLRERDLVIRVLLHHRIGDHDPAAVEILEPSDDDVKPPDGLRGFHANEPSDELLVVRIPVKLAIEPRRRDLQLVLRRYYIVDVEIRADLLRDA